MDVFQLNYLSCAS